MVAALLNGCVLQVIALSAFVAAASAGYLAAPAVAPVAYSAPAVVAAPVAYKAAVPVATSYQNTYKVISFNF